MPKAIPRTGQALLLSIAAGLAHAQTPPRPPADAIERREAAESETLNQPAASVSVTPRTAGSASPAAPGLTSDIDWLEGLSDGRRQLERPSLLPERTFLAVRRGRLIAGPAGMWLFAPDPDQASPGGPVALLLHPCRVTERIASAAGVQSRFRASVSGQVFVYRGRNYLLPSDFRRLSDTEPKAEPQTEPRPATGAAEQEAPEATASVETPEAPATASPPAAGDAEIDALLSELRAEFGEPDPGTNSTAPSSATAEAPAARPAAAPPAELQTEPQTEAPAGAFREGEIITRRRGRLDRGADGRWVFVLDNDQDRPEGGLGAEPASGAMVLLPSRMLQNMERQAELGGTERSMLVSGRVFLQGREAYLLPTMFSLPLPFDVDPMQ